nr:uncharacterized protein LOC107372477 [Nothobranchius furzeri]
MASRGTASHFWSDEETSVFIGLVKSMNIMSLFDDRKCRDSEIYKKITEKLREAGFVRTPDQVKYRWKMLKKAYYKAKKQNNTSGSNPFSFPQFDLMDEILGNRPISTAEKSGVDIGFEDVQEQLSDQQDSGGTLDLTDAATPTASDVTSGSGSHLEGEDVMDENTGGSSRRSRHRASLTQHQQFLERMQHRQNQWFEQQMQLSYASDQALMSQMIAESTRSMGTVVTQLLTGLSVLFQRPIPQPIFNNSQSQPIFQPYNNHFDYRQPPAPPHRVPYSHNNQTEHDHSDDQDPTPFFQP